MNLVSDFDSFSFSKLQYELAEIKSRSNRSQKQALSEEQHTCPGCPSQNEDYGIPLLQHKISIYREKARNLACEEASHLSRKKELKDKIATLVDSGSDINGTQLATLLKEKKVQSLAIRTIHDKRLSFDCLVSSLASDLAYKNLKDGDDI